MLTRTNSSIQDSPGNVKTAFPVKSWVEYWSCASNRWTHGQIHCVDTSENDLVRYQVIAGPKRLLRRMVGMDQLRPRLRLGEHVSFKAEGSWVPARILQEYAIGFHLRRYPIQVESSSEELEGIGAELLRPRYTPGQEVFVYRGPSAGWVPARVFAEQDGPAPPANPSLISQNEIPEWQVVTVNLHAAGKIEVPGYFVSVQDPCGAKGQATQPKGLSLSSLRAWIGGVSSTPRQCEAISSVEAQPKPMSAAIANVKAGVRKASFGGDAAVDDDSFD